MPTCSFCPGRSFVDDNAVRMHKDSQHWWCQSCDRLFWKEEHLDQHNSAKHPSFTCDTCDQKFGTRQALDQHMTDKHPPLFECEYCDLEFTTDEGRLSHEKAKHPTFECEYCDREFTTDEGRLAHEEAKHPMFECEYCDREFTTDEGRLSHEQAEHPPVFECEYCDREFSSEGARRQHEEAKHPPTYECRHCDREFTSEETRSQHEDAEHTNFCELCNKSFAFPEALNQHLKTKKHFHCGECGRGFATQDGLNTHKKVVHSRPSVGTAPIFPSISRPSAPFSSSLSNDIKATQTPAPQKQESAVPTPSESDTEEMSDSGASSADDEDLSTPRNGVSTSQEGVRDGTASEQSCVCTICQRSCESCACTICQQASPVSKTENLVRDDAGSTTPADLLADPVGQDDTAVEREAHCPSCFKVVDAKEGLGEHVCPSFESMLPLHCSACYTQFADLSSLGEHLLEGRRSFSCQLCATSCCSSEMLQDHLLSHPVCARCGDFFIDDPSLCQHVESTHPVVVCWDCDGAVVEQSSLELHYTDSPAHPSCPFCEIGKRNEEDLDEHVKNDHATAPEIAVFAEVGKSNASLDRELPTDEQASQGGEAGVVRNLSDESDLLPLLPPGEISLSIPSMPPQTRHHVEVLPNSSVVNGQESLELALRVDPSPSPTPSEHGSNGSRSRLLTRTPEPTENILVHDVSRPQSLASSTLAESFSDISSPTSSCHSIVYISADGIPDYVRENRAYLVATSVASPSSDGTPLRLPSTYSPSLESLELPERHEPQDNAVPVSNVPGPSTSAPTHRLHCRICLRDPCQDMTATICGHIFCKRCITRAVVSKSECPVCKSATLLYCLFKLDLSA